MTWDFKVSRITWEKACHGMFHNVFVYPRSSMAKLHNIMGYKLSTVLFTRFSIGVSVTVVSALFAVGVLVRGVCCWWCNDVFTLLSGFRCDVMQCDPLFGCTLWWCHCRELLLFLFSRDGDWQWWSCWWCGWPWSSIKIWNLTIAAFPLCKNYVTVPLIQVLSVVAHSAQ